MVGIVLELSIDRWSFLLTTTADNKCLPSSSVIRYFNNLVNIYIPAYIYLNVYTIPDRVQSLSLSFDSHE